MKKSFMQIVEGILQGFTDKKRGSRYGMSKRLYLNFL